MSKTESIRKAILRADGSTRLGLGHLIRSLALLQEFRRRGWQVALATRQDELSGVLDTPMFHNLLIDTELIPVPPDTEIGSDELTVAGFENADLVIVDYYGIDADVEVNFCPTGALVLVIDDLADRRHACDVLVDQTMGRQTQAYENLIPKGCRQLLGQDFVLLRETFADIRKTSLLRRRHPIKHIIVALGATDARGETAEILSALQDLRVRGTDFSLHIILSKLAPGLDTIRTILADAPADWELSLDVEDMASVYADTDLAIGALGGSSWERACLGLPTIALLSAENQHGNADAFVAAGAAVIIPSGERLGTRVAAKVQELINDKEQHHALSAAAADLCDGGGVIRVADIIEAMINGRTIRKTKRLPDIDLRPICVDDRQIIFDWQCLPETRQYARNPKPPSWQEHCDWFNRRLVETAGAFLMIEFAGTPIGLVRLDPSREKSGLEVSIALIPTVYGQGFAQAALSRLPEFAPTSQLLAYVKPANERSVRLFRQAGYEPLPKCGWYQRKPEISRNLEE